MTRAAPIALLLVFSSLLGFSREARAADSYYNCTGFITSIPAVISTPGIWCMNQDLSTSMNGGTAIQISSNNVVIDCNDFTLDGSPGGPDTYTFGIATDAQLDVTVRHCNIRGFHRGIDFLAGPAYSSGEGGHFLVEDNRLDGNTGMGMLIAGDGSVIRRNQVLNSGGSSGAGLGGHQSAGIWAWGSGSVDILDNTVSGVQPPPNTAFTMGEGFGIVIGGSTAGSVSRNIVRDVHSSEFMWAYAISSADVQMVTITDNQIWGDGTMRSGGIWCNNLENSRAKDNTISGFNGLNGWNLPINGCSDDGGNVVNP